MEELEQAGFVDVSTCYFSGVYALVSEGEVIYVGKSVNVFGRVYLHVKARDKGEGVDGTSPKEFDQVYIKLCSEGQLDDEEGRLYHKYHPRMNKIPVPTRLESPEDFVRRV